MGNRQILVFLFFAFFVFPIFGDAGRLLLATTTSTQNSGLLDALLPEFEKDTGVRVSVIAVGTGKALRLGESGDVDCLLVHAPDSEMEFVAREFGVLRREVMHNDFVIVGPINDPVGLTSIMTAAEAFRKIQRSATEKAGVLFISRGDDSGTHKKELALWQIAGIVPDGNWYREVGQGMGATLVIANQIGAYTLADRATFVALQSATNLAVVFESDGDLHNPYGIIAVNPKRHPGVNYPAAEQLIKWIVSEKGQRLIGEFRIAGEQLFFPDAHLGVRQ